MGKAAWLGLIWAGWIGLGAGMSATTLAQMEQEEGAGFDFQKDLLSLSLEDLMNVKVTSVSKREESLAHASAAVFVLTQEDLRRMGATSLPDALRYVPGLEVARINANQWAITSRGFNGHFANKLLVLIDGRSVYTPLFSGVYWDTQDTLLEDIERIEVIRGPGATLWGANAVNGISNVITKRAGDTPGGLMTGGGGSEERGFGAIRHGGELAEGIHYRAFAKYSHRDGSADFANNDLPDHWRMARLGMRVDWDRPQTNDQLSLQSGAYAGESGARYGVPTLSAPYTYFDDVDTDLRGGFLLARWSRTHSSNFATSLSIYYDYYRRQDLLYGDKRDTFDIDLQNRCTWGARHEIVWGLNTRATEGRFRDSFYVNDGRPAMRMRSNTRGDTLFSAFVEDCVTLVPDRLQLTVGSKFEYNDYTGFELQPSARLLYTPHQRHAVWASIARAVRTPSWAEEHVGIQYRILETPLSPLPVMIELSGNPRFESEQMLSFEAGYRWSLSEAMSLDCAAFYNEYDDLRSIATGFPQLAPGYVLVPAVFNNELRGETYGVELVANARLAPPWRMQAAYSFLRVELHGFDDPLFPGESGEGDSPRHQAFVRSSWDLPCNWELDLGLRYVDSLPSQGVDSYFDADARLGWKPSERCEVALVAKQLLDDRRSEYRSELFGVTGGEVERSVSAKITWRF